MIENLPVRARLTVWYTAVLSLGLLLFSLTIWLVLRHLLYADLNTALTNQARGFEEYLHIEERDQFTDLIGEMDEFSRSMPQDHLLGVFDSAGEILYSNNLAAAARFAGPPSTAGFNGPRSFHWKHEHFLALSRPVMLKRGPIRVFFAISSTATERAVSLLAFLLALTVPLFIVCAALSGYWLSRKALLPVDRITERARTVGVGNLSERLAVPRTRDELQRLTETWNGMLERLGTAVSRISRFTADASHELRTPVAIVRLAAENALRKPRTEAEYRSALERIQRESANMTHLIEDLLFLARADVEETTAQAEVIDLNPLIQEACFDVGPLASAKNLDLAQYLPDQPVRVSGNISDLRRMLLILLDNAIKYTPPAGRVSIRLVHDDSQAILSVEDSGIGIPEEARMRVFQRFFVSIHHAAKNRVGMGWVWLLHKQSYSGTTPPSSSHRSRPAAVSSRFRCR